jgi:glucokinase
MAHRRIGTDPALLEANDFRVLDQVRLSAETTRSQLSEALGLSGATVSRVIRRLVQEGHVIQRPGTSTGGRPGHVLEYNRRSGCVIGIDLGGTKCHGGIADLGGELLDEDVVPARAEGTPFDTLAAMVDRLLARAARLRLPVQGVAIGVPAIIDPDAGLAYAGPNVGWHGFPLRDQLEARLDVPFVVENDVNLAALAHAWRGNARGVRDFVVVAIGTGIGAAVVINGRLVKGRHNAAGEIGSMVLGAGNLGRGKPGELGDFERVAAGPAIVARFAAARPHPDDSLTGEPPTAEDAFAAAVGGDPTARQIVNDAVDSLSVAIIAMIATIDPEAVILDGSVGRAFEPFLDQIRERIVAHVAALPPRLSVSSLGTNATVLGAVAAALQLGRRQRAPGDLFDSFPVGPDASPMDVALDVA